jgi:type I site-specific restriction endonuclease
MPKLIEEGLRSCQVDAVKNLEISLSENRPRALIQMATGSGKTYAAVTACYRLICITTIQRLYSMLKGESEFDEELEERSLFDLSPTSVMKSKEVEYNPKIPIESFDFIITDECHRSIYNLWRQVL